MSKTVNINIEKMDALFSPKELKEKYPLDANIENFIFETRNEIQDILGQKSTKRLAIVGPCSIHDIDAAEEYAEKLKILRNKFSDKLCIVMRSYFEKPRTKMGWKGLINDPDLTGEKNIQKGIALARKLLLDLAKMEIPTATEMLDTIIPQYISDLVSYASIGARTTESQPHREMASGLSMPVGFKNATDGNLSVALNGMTAALHSHSFIGIDQNGQLMSVKTTGNPYVHLVLRGGHRGPNYDETSIKNAVAQLEAADLKPSLIVDCSHGNSEKKYKNQEKALKSILSQIKDGNHHISGFMLEGFLKAGNQALPEDLNQLTYGQSITDECLDWELTEDLLHFVYSEL